MRSHAAGRRKWRPDRIRSGRRAGWRGWLARRRRIQGDRCAQMMLLTAVLLIIGFVALSGIVARVSTVGSQTAAVRDNAVAQEAPQVAVLVDELVLGLLDNATYLNQNSIMVTNDDTPSFRQNVTSALAHLELLERSRGFRLTYDPAVCGSTDDIARVRIELHDRTTRVTFLSDETYRNSGDC